MEKSRFVSGFVSIIGRPNAGKSTLLNALVGTKLAIVADKPQTTRTTVQGIWNSDGAQIIFLDTPGIHKSDSLINRRMMGEVRTALDHRDLLLFMADVTSRFEEADEHALDLLRKTTTPAFLVMNKIDRIDDKRQLLPAIDAFRGKFDFREHLPVSAKTGEGLDELRRSILTYLPEGPVYFPPDQITDQPERFLASELIREKILHETRQEVPHSVAVFIDVWEEKRTLTHISATIYVEREGQKGIIIGSKGAMLKRIGSAARTDIEHMLGRKVFLELFVKVRENWRESPAFLNQLNWRASMAGNQSDEDGPATLPGS
jgi:GTP-binding protein Era